ncbi:MAG: S8 family serine peptidase [Pseudomonadota bacterium]
MNGYVRPLLVIVVSLCFLGACTHGVDIVGEGDVRSSSGTRDCLKIDAPCSFEVSTDYLETYTALPAAGHTFKEWRNCGNYSLATCRFTVPETIVRQFAGQTMPSVVAVFEPISAAFEFSGIPTQSGVTSVSIVTGSAEPDLQWQVVSQPADSSLDLDLSNGNKTVSFVADEPGEYEIRVVQVSSNTDESTAFTVLEEFAFDPAKIDGNDGTLPMDRLIGAIINQSWVDSSTLSESDLTSLVQQFGVFLILGYDEINGLLIEYDETSVAALEALEELKLTMGISSVFNRLHEGENVPRNTDVIPRDGSPFDDGQDNWHLEDIGAVEAWEYTKGSADILIGVTDSGFDRQHRELQGRVQSSVAKKRDHGNAVAGAIGAETDNGFGMSGVNWFSKMMLDLSGQAGLRKQAKNEKVVSINSSWVMSGYVPSSFNSDTDQTANFDTTDNNVIQARKAYSLRHTRPYRKLVIKNSNKLFVWAAGNGIGNGKGNGNGVYGVDGRLENAALHYGSNGKLVREKNAVMVAAMRSDHRLAYYSAYGRAIDIAAPTSFKSLKVDGQFYTEGNAYGDGSTGFTGTSAAAPVVTGVASLIYSLNPDFTAAEVKDILEESATSMVTERYKAPGGPGVDNSNIEALVHPIPILNAAKAMELAQEAIDSKVRVSDTIPDAAQAVARVVFETYDPELRVKDIIWESFSSADRGVTWQSMGIDVAESNTAMVPLDQNTPYHRLQALLTIENRDGSTELSANKEHEFTYSTATLIAKDAETLDPISGVSIDVETQRTGSSSAVQSDSSGRAMVYLKAGRYKVGASADEYEDTVASLTVSGTDDVEKELFMAPNELDNVGSISGTVSDLDGMPIAGAVVSIFSGFEDNAVSASASTDSNGEYSIPNISKVRDDDTLVQTFEMTANASGYTESAIGGVIVLSGKERTENFTLADESIDSDPIDPAVCTGTFDWQTNCPEGSDSGQFTIAANNESCDSFEGSFDSDTGGSISGSVNSNFISFERTFSGGGQTLKQRWAGTLQGSNLRNGAVSRTAEISEGLVQGDCSFTADDPDGNALEAARICRTAEESGVLENGRRWWFEANFGFSTYYEHSGYLCPEHKQASLKINGDMLIGHSCFANWQECTRSEPWDATVIGPGEVKDKAFFEGVRILELEYQFVDRPRRTLQIEQ